MYGPVSVCVSVSLCVCLCLCVCAKTMSVKFCLLLLSHLHRKNEGGLAEDSRQIKCKQVFV